MKCQACGFEDGPEVEEVKVLFKSGKRKGQVSHVETRETHNPQWISLGVERGFDFEALSSDRGWGEKEARSVRLSACPICSTVRAH